MRWLGGNPVEFHYFKISSNTQILFACGLQIESTEEEPFIGLSNVLNCGEQFSGNKVRTVEKQDAARNRHLANDVPDCGNAVVQCCLRIGKRVTTFLADDSPFLHLVAAKHSPGSVLDVDNQQSLRRQ